MRTYSRHIRNLAAMVLLLLGAVAFPNLVLDPYQILHRQLQEPATFSTNRRFQVPGLIRLFLRPTTGYDSIIVGTSMTLNFRPSEVSAAFHWGKTLPLSIKGASPWETGRVLDLALSTGCVRHVLAGLYRSYPNNPGLSRDSSFPEYLYEGNTLRYILNLGTLRAAFEAYRSDSPNWKPDLDSYNLWNPNVLTFNTPSNLSKLNEELRLKRLAPRIASQGRSLEFPSFNEQFLQQVRSHPDTQFVCFFPPYSLFYFATLSEVEFQRLMDFYEHAVLTLSDVMNAQVFGFDTCFDFTGNLANYSDETHYRAAMNSAMLQFMAAGRHRLTPQVWPDYRRQLTEAARDYRLKSDFAAAEAWVPEP